MFEKRIPVEGAQRLILADMASHVVLDAWQEADVLIRLPEGREEDLAVEETEQGPALSARTHCEVWVPAALPVTVRQAQGHLRVKGLASLNAEQVRGHLRLDGVDEAVLAEVYGNLRAESAKSLRLVGTIYGNARLSEVQSADVQNVRGQLVAKSTGRLRVTRLGGNLTAKGIGEALDADQIGGNAVLKSIAGSVTVDQVAGNVVAKSLAGGAQIPRIGGNMTFNGELGPGRSYHFQCDGNAILRFPEGANAHLSLKAGGRILSSLDLADREEEGGRLSGTLGEGGTEVMVEARGNIIAGDRSQAVGADLGEEISRQINESLQAIDLEAIGHQVSEEMEDALSRLRVKLEGVDWERMGQRAQEAVERAMERMEHDMGRAMDQVSRQQERLQRRLEREALRRERRAHREPRHGVEVDFSWEEEMEAEASAPDAGPNLDEERLSILRMVEQGQISPEEAEMLLDALE
jgi:hypothetical protein